MKAFVGTSGYSYREWKGRFYPEDLPNDKMLGFYAERFGTVEINNTFYRMPSSKLIETWARQVPDGFSFVLKASRRITHQARLERPRVEESISYLLAASEKLGDKLGPLLFQLPPFFRKDLPRLEGFLELLPENRRATLEFRHGSWFDDEVYDALRARDVALCYSDSELKDKQEVPFVSTAGWGYLRLRGTEYDDETCRAWTERIRAQGWRDVYVFFKHEDEATGPRLAARFETIFNGVQ